jgi:hypothetical protein
MALDYDVLERAIAAWLASSTGLPDASILSRNSKVPQPALPYIEYTVPAAAKTNGRDELRTSYDATADAGAEIIYTTRGNRETTVSVQVRTKSATGTTDSDGLSTARGYAEDAINALALPSTLAALKAVGLGFIDASGVRDLSDRSGPLGAGRVQFDVRFRLVDGASAATGYIDKVTLDTSSIT